MIRWLLPEGCPDGSRFLLYYRAFIWLISLSSVMTAGHTGCCFRSSNRSHELLQGGHRAVTCSGSGTRIRDTFLTRPLPLRNLSRDGARACDDSRTQSCARCHDEPGHGQAPDASGARRSKPSVLLTRSGLQYESYEIPHLVVCVGCFLFPGTAHRSLAIAWSTWRVQCNLQFASPGNHD